MLEYSTACIMREMWKWKTMTSNTDVLLLLASVIGMVINIITIFHSRNGFSFYFILKQIIWEMIYIQEKLHSETKPTISGWSDLLYPWFTFTLGCLAPLCSTWCKQGHGHVWLPIVPVNFCFSAKIVFLNLSCQLKDSSTHSPKRSGKYIYCKIKTTADSLGMVIKIFI